MDGHAPVQTDAMPAANDAPAPRTGAQLWQAAQKAKAAVGVARGFKTLRDQVGEGYISKRDLKVVRHLGKGAFATVDLARTAGGQQVAVKRLLPEALGSERDVEDFLKETRLLRKLRHGSIVEFIGCGGEDGGGGGAEPGVPPDLFLVQEYCSGGSLQGLVYKQMASVFKPLYSDEDALRWCISVAKALAYLHSARPIVIHRDLKLDNVLLGGSGGSEAKLADFGLARLIVASSRATSGHLGRVQEMIKAGDSMDGTLKERIAAMDRRLDRLLTERSSAAGSARFSAAPSSSGTAAQYDLTARTGSLAYMAPEVLREEPYSEACDVFSFAMVMYNLFHRVIPSVQLVMQGGDEKDLEMYAFKVGLGYRPPIAAGVPAPIKEIIEKCWQARPGDRPTASSLVAMLVAVRTSGVCDAPDGGHAQPGCSCVLS